VPLEKERKEEATQIACRLDIIRLQDKVGMVIEKGATPDAGKLIEGDDTVVQTRGGKVMPKNKYGLLIIYREICTHILSAVTYKDQDE
jgi:hypothetical protein